MTLLYDNRPATKDIDSLFNSDNEELLKNIFNQIQEVYQLNKDLKISSQKQLFNIVTRFIPKISIKERQLTFIKYLGEDLGYDWS